MGEKIVWILNLVVNWRAVSRALYKNHKPKFRLFRDFPQIKFNLPISSDSRQ